MVELLVMYEITEVLPGKNQQIHFVCKFSLSLSLLVVEREFGSEMSLGNVYCHDGFLSLVLDRVSFAIACTSWLRDRCGVCSS